MTYEQAMIIQNKIMNDPNAFTKGRRNTDAVDLCIAAKVKSVEDNITLDEFIDDLIEHLKERPQRFDAIDFRLRYRNIKKYLDDWYNDKESGIENYLVRDLGTYVDNE